MRYKDMILLKIKLCLLIQFIKSFQIMSAHSIPFSAFLVVFALSSLSLFLTALLSGKRSMRRKPHSQSHTAQQLPTC